MLMAIKDTLLGIPPTAPQYTNTVDTNKKQRIIIGVVGTIVLLIVLIAVLLLVFSRPSIKPDIGDAAAAHQEIARLADLGLSSDQATRSTLNKSANIKAIATDNLNQLTNYVSANFDDPLSRATLESDESSTANTLLEQAEQSNRFDEELLDILPQAIEAAQSETSSLFEKTDNDELKAILNEIFEKNTSLLELFE